MTLVKTKTRVTPQQRKVGAGHHRKSQKYLKTYWPYLPIVLILGGAFVANQHLPSSLSSGATTSAADSARIESIVGVNNVVVYVMYAVLLALIVWYAARHIKRLKSLMIDGERFLAKHYVLDISAALVIAGLYVLVR